MYITFRETTDGFGSQFQKFLFGIPYIEMNDNIFVYTPIKKMDHNYDNDPLFIEKIENLMNIKNNYLNINDTDNLNIIDFQYYQEVEKNIDY